MKWLTMLLLMLSMPAWSTAYFAAHPSFTPAGSDSNDGLSAANPKTHTWCFTPGSLSGGDSCTFAAGNYGTASIDIDTIVLGSAGNLITFQCAGKYTCSFSLVRVHDSDYVELINFQVDSEFYDGTHSYNNPLVSVFGSDHIWFTANMFRGEPQRCKDGWLVFNGGAGNCSSNSTYNRYQDLVIVGGKDSTADASSEIAFRSSDTFGEMQFIDGNHAQLEFHDDRDTGDPGNTCTADEINYYVAGTPTTPLIFSNTYHHNVSNKGVCAVLFEHVDFRLTGTGRGDTPQPDGSSGQDDQQGVPLHGSDHEYYGVRFSTFSFGGDGTEDNGNNAGISDIGLFGQAGSTPQNTVEDVCYAHLSSWRNWGVPFTIGRFNEITLVDDVVILNSAHDEMGYLNTTEGGGTADLIPIGYVIDRIVNSSSVTVFVDGIVFDNVTGLEGDKFLYDQIAAPDDTYASSACPTTVEGIQCGSNITYSNTAFFTDPLNRDYTILDTTRLQATAEPIGQTSDSGTGSTIGVDYPWCFFDDLNGLRASGDVLDINTDECTVVSVNRAGGTITCNETITWALNDDIQYKVGGVVHDDIGAIISGGAGPGEPNPGPGRNLKPHQRSR